MKTKWLVIVIVSCLAAALAGAGIATLVKNRAAGRAESAGSRATGQVPAAAPGALTFNRIEWDELVPKEWDPLKRFRALNLATLQDDDPRAQLLLSEMRAAWDNAPTVASMDGAAVQLPGYVVPLEHNGDLLTEFLLVPYFGACIHSPPPPANQILHVQTTVGEKLRAMDSVWVSGVIERWRTDSDMGVSGYRMQAMAIQAYSGAADR